MRGTYFPERDHRAARLAVEYGLRRQSNNSKGLRRYVVQITPGVVQDACVAWCPVIAGRNAMVCRDADDRGVRGGFTRSDEQDDGHRFLRRRQTTAPH